jgi:hypothetical protein
VEGLGKSNFVKLVCVLVKTETGTSSTQPGGVVILSPPKYSIYICIYSCAPVSTDSISTGSDIGFTTAQKKKIGKLNK